MHLLFYMAAFLSGMNIICAALSNKGNVVPEFRVLKHFVPLKQNEQFFEQGPNGQYAYGYREPNAEKQEIRTEDGLIHGYYSFIDANGVPQTVQYFADANGFHVPPTNLPNMLEAVTETPEVAEARVQHLAAHEMVKLRNAMLLRGSVSIFDNFLHPVKDTKEVAHAKAEFFKRYEYEILHHKLLRDTSLRSKLFNSITQE